MSKQFFTLIIVVSLFSETALAEYYPIDTTKVREVVPVKKSTGEKIADIPGEILKLPIYVAQYTSRTVSTSPAVSKVFLTGEIWRRE